jgi:hypothetical protein
VANLVEQPGRRKLLLHLVNYGKPMALIQSVKVNCRAPVRSVRVYSPDADVQVVTVGNDGSFAIPQVQTYSIAAMELDGETGK